MKPVIDSPLFINFNLVVTGMICVQPVPGYG